MATDLLGWVGQRGADVLAGVGVEFLLEIGAGGESAGISAGKSVVKGLAGREGVEEAKEARLIGLGEKADESFGLIIEVIYLGIGRVSEEHQLRKRDDFLGRGEYECGLAI